MASAAISAPSQTVHLGMRDHTCPFDGCHKTYTQSNNLSFHIKIFHKGIHNHICPYSDCHKVFGYKHVLNTHIKELHQKVRDHIGRGRNCVSKYLDSMSEFDESAFNHISVSEDQWRATIPESSSSNWDELFYVYIFLLQSDNSIIKTGYSMYPRDRLRRLKAVTKLNWSFHSCIGFEDWTDAWAVEQYIHALTIEHHVSLKCAPNLKGARKFEKWTPGVQSLL